MVQNQGLKWGLGRRKGKDVGAKVTVCWERGELCAVASQGFWEPAEKPLFPISAHKVVLGYCYISTFHPFSVMLCWPCQKHSIELPSSRQKLEERRDCMGMGGEFGFCFSSFAFILQTYQLSLTPFSLSPPFRCMPAYGVRGSWWQII